MKVGVGNGIIDLTMITNTCPVCNEIYTKKYRTTYCSLHCFGITQIGKMSGENSPSKRPDVRLKISKGLTGKTPSLETRKKMSLAKLGKPGYWTGKKRLSMAGNKYGFLKGNISWNKGKHMLSQMGKNHWNWKGGSSSEREKAIKTLEYKQWRDAVFKRDNYICKECGVTNGNGKSIFLQAHHIKPWSKFPELRYDINNGITLCKKCHSKTFVFFNNQYTHNE